MSIKTETVEQDGEKLVLVLEERHEVVLADLDARKIAIEREIAAAENEIRNLQARIAELQTALGAATETAETAAILQPAVVKIIEP